MVQFLILILGLLIWACTEVVNDEEKTFDLQDWKNKFSSERIKPSLENVEQALETFENIQKSWCEEATPIDSLSQAWISLYKSWKIFEMHSPLLTERSLLGFHTWPIRENLLANARAKLVVNADLAGEDVSGFAKGLATMEYILFQDASKTNDCSYLKFISREFSNDLDKVFSNSESEENTQPYELFPNDEKEFFHALLYQWMEQIETLRRVKIGKPFFGNGKEPWVNAVETPWAEVSAYGLKNPLAELFAIWSIEPKIEDYFNSRSGGVGTKFYVKLEQCSILASALNKSFKQEILARSERVSSLYSCLEELTALIRIDLGPAVGTVISFSGVDGD
jgi:predicted lipoprotein